MTGNFAGFIIKGLKADQKSNLAYILGRLKLPTRQAYRIGVRHIAWDRLSQEERVEETLEDLQWWGNDGTPNSMHIPNHRPPTSFLHQPPFITNEPFQICPKSLEPSIEHSVILIASCQPQSHLLPSSSVLTRPFRTDPHIYDLATHDESVVVFGVDLQ